MRRALTTALPQLSKYPALNNLEKQAGVPKAYAAIGVGALYFFLIVFNLGGQLLTNFAGFVIPGYYSLQALFTSNTKDDTQWLTVCAPLPPLSCFPSLGGGFLALIRHGLRRNTDWHFLFQYWVVFALFTVLESFINIVYWFPFYFVFKFIFLLWLSLPPFQ